VNRRKNKYNYFCKNWQIWNSSNSVIIRNMALPATCVIYFVSDSTLILTYYFIT